MKTTTTRIFRLCAFVAGLLSFSLLQAQPLYDIHWTSNSDPSFSGSGGAALTQTLDSACSMMTVSVTDTANAPLGAFNALILNPQIPGGGGDLVDLSGNMSFHLRVRSRETVTLGFLLRAGDGSSAFRTDRITQVVPGDTSAWTEVTFTFDATTIAGFDSTDLRDVWIYLDPGTENFAGNEFIFDYFSIGQMPDSLLNSDCPADTVAGPVQGINYALHFDSSADPLFSGSAAASLTQTLDSACSQLLIQVTDPATAPWNGTSPVIINPKDASGSDIADLSGSMAFHLRARSLDTVEVGLQLRAADGTSAFRTNRVSQIIPGDTTAWTELTFSFDTTDLAGFDSTDLRDIWLFLDYGEDNFAGNRFWVDYFAIGELPDPSTHSGCSLLPPFEFPWVLHWADTTDEVTSGSGAVQLSQVVDTACSQLQISVLDPVGDPHPAFRPIIFNPFGKNGVELQDLSGHMQFDMRVRSLAEVELSMVLRSGDGSQANRTEIVPVTVPAGLGEWHDVSFTFNGADLGGFDSTDLRDVWIYLNREEANFSGNEFYIDFISICGLPDEAQLSDCVESVGMEDQLSGNLSVYPNPVQAGEPISVRFEEVPGTAVQIQVLTLSGQVVTEHQAPMNQTELTIQPPSLPAGMYLLHIRTTNGLATRKLIIR